MLREARAHRLEQVKANLEKLGTDEADIERSVQQIVRGSTTKMGASKEELKQMHRSSSVIRDIDMAALTKELEEGAAPPPEAKPAPPRAKAIVSFTSAGGAQPIGKPAPAEVEVAVEPDPAAAVGRRMSIDAMLRGGMLNRNPPAGDTVAVVMGGSREESLEA